MAIPRKIAAVQPAPKLACRQPGDFPAFQAAAEKVADLQQRKAIKQMEVRADEDKPVGDRSSRVRLMARSLVDDVPVCLDIAPDLRALREELEVLELAEQMATRQLDSARQAMARELAKDLAPTHRSLLQDFFDKQAAANEAHDAIRAFAGAATALAGCEVLPEYGVDGYKVLVFRTAVELFRTCSADYVKGAI
jgi:hypothetical protein